MHKKTDGQLFVFSKNHRHFYIEMVNASFVTNNRTYSLIIIYVFEV